MKTVVASLLMGIALLGGAVLSPVSLKAEEQTRYKTVQVNGVKVFYREAGPIDAPVVVLLHGFPTSSHMFRNLIQKLAANYRVLTPDYPGFGNSEQPAMKSFEYTFDNLARTIEGFLEQVGAKKYSLYVMDYGAPIGFRIAVRNPKRIQSLIVQNGNAYEEGLLDFWKPIKRYWSARTPENAKPLTEFITPAGVKWQYTHGVRDESTISPDNWNVDLQHLTRAENPEIQLQLFYDYGSNPPLYPKWQEYFRKYQPPTLVVWGKNDYIFPEAGAHPYKRDLKKIDFHILNTGHFALEEDGDVIAAHMLRFLKSNIK